MVFLGSRQLRFNGIIKMGAATLKRVSNAKYLGLTIDDKLNWNCHVTELCKNISKVCNMMYKLRHFLPLPSRISVYYSLFHCRVSYGILCWGLLATMCWTQSEFFKTKSSKLCYSSHFSSELKRYLYSRIYCVLNILLTRNSQTRT